ncbi:collagen alpha-1(III) chain-like [Cervus canadensis]|uniref:collagen alpha-1(III) chain-like n=1 Tax=Cervus canadensis TaxID=1574408 RepID=UPI001CA31D12|nr:collagen alpha-1(III) chain-like [Cervus canadensis]
MELRGKRGPRTAFRNRSKPAYGDRPGGLSPTWPERVQAEETLGSSPSPPEGGACRVPTGHSAHAGPGATAFLPEVPGPPVGHSSSLSADQGHMMDTHQRREQGAGRVDDQGWGGGPGWSTCCPLPEVLAEPGEPKGPMEARPARRRGHGCPIPSRPCTRAAVVTLVSVSWASQDQPHELGAGQDLGPRWPSQRSWDADPRGPCAHVRAPSGHTPDAEQMEVFFQGGRLVPAAEGGTRNGPGRGGGWPQGGREATQPLPGFSGLRVSWARGCPAAPRRTPQPGPPRRPEVLPYRETSRCSKRLVGQDGWAGPRETVPGVSSGHLSRPRPSPTFPDTARLPSALQFNVSQAKLNQEQERAAVLACLQSLWPGALLLSQAPGALGDRGTRGGRTPGGSGSPQPSLQKRPGSDSLGRWLGASAPPTGQLRPAPPGPPPALPADLSGPRATRFPQGLQETGPGAQDLGSGSGPILQDRSGGGVGGAQSPRQTQRAQPPAEHPQQSTPSSRTARLRAAQTAAADPSQDSPSATTQHAYPPRPPGPENVDRQLCLLPGAPSVAPPHDFDKITRFKSRGLQPGAAERPSSPGPEGLEGWGQRRPPNPQWVSCRWVTGLAGKAEGAGEVSPQPAPASGAERPAHGPCRGADMHSRPFHGCGEEAPGARTPRAAGSPQPQPVQFQLWRDVCKSCSPALGSRCVSMQHPRGLA